MADKYSMEKLITCKYANNFSGARAFGIKDIKIPLKRFQEFFPHLNEYELKPRREPFDNAHFNNIIRGYEHVNGILRKKTDITPNDLIELNMLCLYGACTKDLRDPKKNTNMLLEYSSAVEVNRKKFSAHISPVWKYYERNKGADPFNLASGIYILMVSCPQLFVEGNQRTGSLMMAFILASRGRKPFVLDSYNAAKFLNLSEKIKLTRRNRFFERLRLPKHRGDLRNYLLEDF